MLGISKKKNKENKKQTILKILVKLQQLRIGDPELLDDIQLDIEEGIPLSKTKIEYMKNLVQRLKERNLEQKNFEILDKQTTKT